MRRLALLTAAIVGLGFPLGLGLAVYMASGSTLAPPAATASVPADPVGQPSNLPPLATTDDTTTGETTTDGTTTDDRTTDETTTDDTTTDDTTTDTTETEDSSGKGGTDDDGKGRGRGRGRGGDD
jgi:hypothetical protein